MKTAHTSIYAIKKKGVNVTASIDRSKVDHITYANYANIEDTIESEKFTLGMGLGLDYGGFGGNATFYLNNNIGVFAGLGYALAGAGVNAGLRGKLITKRYTRRVVPFYTGMYGYNTSIAIPDARHLSKLFYGPSFGLGLDIHQKKPKTGLWSFALLLPVRSKKVDEYMNMLKTTQGVTFSNGLTPITFSIGFKFKLQ